MALNDKNIDKKPSATRPGRSERIAQHDDDYVGTPLSMSGIRNGLLHSTGTKIVLALLIFIFAIASVLLSGSSVQSPAGGPAGGAASAGPDPVASVAGQNISRNEFQQALMMQLQFAQQYGQSVGPIELMGMEQNILKTLAERATQYDAATKAGITVSDDETEKEITRLIDEEIKNEKGSDEAAFRRRIEAEYKGGEPEYRENLRKKYDRDLVARSLMLKKLEDSVKEANKTTEEDYKKSVTKLQLKQIVIHPQTPGPEDKDFKAAAEKYATEAMAQAEKLVASLKGKTGPALVQAFVAAAKKESDDNLTKAQGGEVGLKLPNELPVHTTIQAALAKSDSNLVGPLQDEISKHAHIFLIQNRKLELPKDYAKNKAKLLKDFETQKDIEAWTARQEEIRKLAVPDIYDHALLAYRMQTELITSAPEAERDGHRRDAIAQYEEALPSAAPIEKAAIRYQMSQLFRDLKQPNKVVDVLQAAVKDEPTTAQLRIDLARALRENKKPKEAIVQLKEASKILDEHPSSPSPYGAGNPDDAVRQQIAAEFDAAGDAKLAAAERKKIQPAAPSPMGGMGGLGSMGGNPIQINPGR
jgi:hypothetical protein